LYVLYIRLNDVAGSLTKQD